MEQKVITNKKKNKQLGKIITSFFAAVIVVLLAFQIIGTITAQTNYGVASFFGYQTLVVRTDSMEPSYMVGEAIVVKKVELTTLKASTSPEAHDGDTITFYRRNDGLIITHRIIEIIPQEDGSLDFKTLGDNLNAETCGPSACTIENADYVYGEDILGKVVGKSAFFGGLVNLTTNPFVIASVAVIPLMYVFITSIVDVIKHSKMKEEDFVDDDLDEFEAIKQQEKLKLLIELEKEKLRKELLEEQQQKEDEKHEQG